MHTNCCMPYLFLMHENCKKSSEIFLVLKKTENKSTRRNVTKMVNTKKKKKKNTTRVWNLNPAAHASMFACSHVSPEKERKKMPCVCMVFTVSCSWFFFCEKEKKNNNIFGVFNFLYCQLFLRQVVIFISHFSLVLSVLLSLIY